MGVSAKELATLRSATLALTVTNIAPSALARGMGYRLVVEHDPWWIFAASVYPVPETLEGDFNDEQYVCFAIQRRAGVDFEDFVCEGES